MRRYGGLWDQVVRWENLLLAAKKAQRGKRARHAVAGFNFDQERELLAIQSELTDGSYRPGAFRSHWVTRPKARMISVAPYRDRVVHHALMNVLEPILDRHFHPDSYACRKGKGTHAAANRLQRLMGRKRYALQCDIRKFFPSIDHEVMKATFRRLIKDPRVLWLMDLIVDASNEQERAVAWYPGDDLLTPLERRHGLPIGNLTSQWFANWMLNDLDHWVTSHLGVGGYVRYCDDFILLDDDWRVLRRALGSVVEHLRSKRLSLHGRKVVLRPTRCGVTFVGYRIWPTHRIVRKDNVRAFRRRVRWMRQAYREGRVGLDHIQPRLASWIAHARQAASERLIARLSREWRFTRGGTDTASCPSRRQLEQQCDQLPVHVPQHENAVESEQQQRVPVGPALSGSDESSARNRAVHGRRERGLESPGPAPVLFGGDIAADGRICVGRSDGAGRPGAEGPIRRLGDRGRQRRVSEKEDACMAGALICA